MHHSPSTDPLEHLTPDERRIVQKPTHALIEVTDVGDFPGDFDAEQTILARHLRPLRDVVYSIGKMDPRVLKYAADFLTGLPSMIRDRIGHAELQAARSRRSVPEDVATAMRDWEDKTLRVLLNYAPRDQKREERRNGNDFYLAFVDGVEVYAVPAGVLQYLKIRNKIDALFRIPTEGHPLTTSLEQFRSSLYGMTGHEAPEHLELVWRRGNCREVLDHVIPDLEHDEVAFIDQPYHNRRIITPDLSKLLEDIEERQFIDGTVLVRVGQSVIRANVANCLANIPEGEWGLWHNPADIEEGESAAGYYELSRRWEPGTNWGSRGQFPSHYLSPKDRGIGAEVEILPTSASRRVRDFVRLGIARFRKAL
ncbi:hypothetical protein HYZ99_05745 [Candidatus Peregrinibacteria bacterium]|nr:hypothetical protein [Candidatus Peregrinibacteria bacterium]